MEIVDFWKDDLVISNGRHATEEDSPNLLIVVHLLFGGDHFKGEVKVPGN